MSPELKLEIVTPSRRLVEATVEELYLPGATGEIGVLPEHAPLVSVLTPGIVKYLEGGEKRAIAIRSGFLKVGMDRVTLLADEAKLPKEVKSEELATERQDVESKMVDASVMPDERAELAKRLGWLDAQAAL